MLRFIGAVLFGGGAIGAFVGWALIQYLEARRKRIVTVVRAVAEDTRRTLNIRDSDVHGPVEPPPKPPEVIQLPPGDPWYQANLQQSFREAQEAAKNDPGIAEWLAKQRERKLAMIELQHRLWEEEERRKHEPRSPE